MNQKFRVLRDFFASVEYYHVVPQMVRHPERVRLVKNDPYGSDFILQWAKSNKRTQQKYKRILEKALKQVVPHFERIDIERDAEGVPHLKMLYKHWRKNAGWQDERQFSDGTLRILGLLFSLLRAQGPLLLEEPELYLHPEAVARVPEVVSEIQASRKKPPQVIITTHSLDMLSEDSGVSPMEVLALVPRKEDTGAVWLGDFKKEIEEGFPLKDKVAELISIGLTSWDVR